MKARLTQRRNSSFKQLKAKRVFVSFICRMQYIFFQLPPFIRFREMGMTLYGGFDPGVVKSLGMWKSLAINLRSPDNHEFRFSSHKSQIHCFRKTMDDPGTITVAISCGAGADALIDGFTYFSPTNPQGGTHGAPVAGTLNVTVLDIYTLKPLAGATVVVGQPGDAVFGSYLGKTDAKGQIIFSGLDLVPPLTVSASKTEYSASSIVQFTVSNATLLLFPYVPPSSGGGGGGGGLPLATLEGRVLDLDKYVLVPPTSCLKPETGGPICDFCTDVTTCGAETDWACSLTGGVTRRCFPLCTTNDDCPQDYRCYDDNEVQGRRVCKPSIGVRRITCQTSTRGLESENPPPGPGSIVDESTGKWSISARLDELAVYCVAGYVMADQSFVPTSMGVRRHIFPEPGGTISDLDLRLDIALQRQLPVRLDHPQPYFPAQNGGALDLRSWIALGSDGYIPLAIEERIPEGIGSTGVVDALTIPYQPLILPEALTDTSQTWRAVVSFGTALTPIETGTQHESIIRPGDNNLLVRSKAGQWQGSPLAVAMSLAGMVLGDNDEVLLVSDRGRLLRGPYDGPSLLYVPTVADAYEDPPAVLAMAGTPHRRDDRGPSRARPPFGRRHCALGGRRAGRGSRRRLPGRDPARGRGRKGRHGDQRRRGLDQGRRFRRAGTRGRLPRQPRRLHLCRRPLRHVRPADTEGDRADPATCGRHLDRRRHRPERWQLLARWPDRRRRERRPVALG